MSSTKRPNPERPDEENPEWTRGDMAKARPAAEVLPKFIGRKATQELLRRGRGRPKKKDRKINQTLRIDPDVLAAYRQEGKGWQTLINQVLRDNMRRHSK
ncbi:MAG: BrnA antitoxin family protein [Terriglobia bacterium]